MFISHAARIWGKGGKGAGGEKVAPPLDCTLFAWLPELSYSEVFRRPGSAVGT